MRKNDKLAEEIKVTREEYRKVIRALIAKGIRDLKEDKIPIQGVADIERLIRLDLYIQQKGYLI